jgi:hypothetical protein
MNWSELLNQAVYPALYGLILILLSIGLKLLATWLKLQAAKTSNEVLRQIVLSAASEIEQKAVTAEKVGETKWSSERKKSATIGAAAEAAANAGLKVDSQTIDHLIESVLGESKLK